MSRGDKFIHDDAEKDGSDSVHSKEQTESVLRRWSPVKDSFFARIRGWMTFFHQQKFLGLLLSRETKYDRENMPLHSCSSTGDEFR